MEFTENLFSTKSTGKQSAIVEYFLSRARPLHLDQSVLEECGDWRCGDTENAVPDANRLLRQKFKEDNGEIISLEWRERKAWNNFKGKALFCIKRGMLLGNICVAWQQTGAKKYLKLFEEFFDMFDSVAKLKHSPLDLSDGDAAFFGGPDPNLPWIKESWGKFHNPMCTGFRMSRFWRIWSSGIFAELPRAIAFRFLKSLHHDLMAYKTIINAPFKAGNHYLFEVGVAPYIAASMFPEFPECAEIKKLAIETINNSLPKTILPDGSLYEHASGYDVVTFNDILCPYFLALKNGEKLLSKSNLKLFKKSARFIRDLFHPNGAMTQFGDSAPQTLKKQAGCSVLEFKKAGLDFTPSKLPANYPKGGYAFLGDNGTRLAISAVNKHNPKGHIHWEHLSFEFCHNGVVWIGDPTAVLRGRDPLTRPLIYSGKARKAVARQYHYSLAAHNCVLIDSLVPGDEPYSEHEFGGVPPKCLAHKFTAEPQSYSASHELFESLGIKHKRVFERVSKRVFQVSDFFSGHPDKRERCYKTLIHPMPGINIKIKGNKAMLSHKGKSITIRFSGGILEAIPDTHVRNFAYTKDEKNLCIIRNSICAKGHHDSAFTIEAN